MDHYANDLRLFQKDWKPHGIALITCKTETLCAGSPPDLPSLITCYPASKNLTLFSLRPDHHLVKQAWRLISRGTRQSLKTSRLAFLALRCPQNSLSIACLRLKHMWTPGGSARAD